VNATILPQRSDFILQALAQGLSAEVCAECSRETRAAARADQAPRRTGGFTSVRGPGAVRAPIARMDRVGAERNLIGGQPALLTPSGMTL
jgi:hypothetical protein